MLCNVLAAATATLLSGNSAPVADAVRMSTVPFKMETSGNQGRAMVQVRFNGHPFPMMIHSNASFVVQLKHKQAREFGIRNMRDVSKGFGIVRPGEVSDLGFGTGIMDSIQVGHTRNRNVPVTVFEIPQDDRGMLGIGWIVQNQVVMDYAAKRATLAPTPAWIAMMRARLLKVGYMACPMTFDEADERYKVQVKIANATRAMTVATASNTTIDPDYAAAAGISRGRQVGSGYGPTGTKVPEYAVGSPFAMKIGEWTTQAHPGITILDHYAYLKARRPTAPNEVSGGGLGSDFLLNHGAVVDFGNKIIYLR